MRQRLVRQPYVAFCSYPWFLLAVDIVTKLAEPPAREEVAMGLDYNATKFILFVKSLDGVDFSHTIALGRQVLSLHRKELASMFSKFRLPVSQEDLDNIYKEEADKSCSTYYAENLLRYLGAHRIDSIDASDYEGAS